MFTLCLISVEIPWGFWEFWNCQMRNSLRVTRSKEKTTSSVRIASAQEHNMAWLWLCPVVCTSLKSTVWIWTLWGQEGPDLWVSHILQMSSRNGNYSMEVATQPSTVSHQEPGQSWGVFPPNPGVWYTLGWRQAPFCSTQGDFPACKSAYWALEPRMKVLTELNHLWDYAVEGVNTVHHHLRGWLLTSI